MARKPENTFIEGVHRYLPPPKQFHREKMNNPYRGGTADWWYSGKAADLWVEYKFLPKIPKIIVPDLSELQRSWLNGRLSEGRNVRVIVGHPQGGVIMTDSSWDNEWDSATFIAQSITRAEIASILLRFCAGGVSSDQVPKGHLSTNRRGVAKG